MFLGEHQHSLDAKGRVILPAKFRDLLEGGVITSETDGCLGLWPPADFEVRAQEIRDRARGDLVDRNVARFFFANAVEASPDKQGRVTLPPHLRDFAQLEREIVVNGAFDHVEIWDATTWWRNKQSGQRALVGAAASASPATTGETMTGDTMTGETMTGETMTGEEATRTS